MAEGLLEWCALLGDADKLGKCHVCAGMTDTIAQRSVHLPAKSMVRGLPWCSLTIFQLDPQSVVCGSVKSNIHGLKTL